MSSAGWRSARARYAEPHQRHSQFPGRPGPAGTIVGEHLDQQRHGVLGPDRDPASGKGAAQRGERKEHEIVALPDVRPLVREHGRELGLIKQIQRARADHDAGPQPGKAVRGSGRVVVAPRLSTNRSMPRSTARAEQAELITPLPPINRTRMPVTLVRAPAGPGPGS